MTDEEVIRSFPAVAAPIEPGFVIDFLGSKTRTSILPRNSVPATGLVEGYPIPMNFHATQAEWGGSLRSVLEAETSFTMIELGAGWGPWMVSMGIAARSRGITDIRLVGVEADESHHQWISDHFRDNGFDASQHTMIRGIVGPADGDAEFPVLDNPAEDWGARANYLSLPRTLRGVFARHRRPMVRLKCVSIPTLVRPLDHVDLLHIDIQGAEADTIAAALPALSAKVRRIVVGTHSRALEQRIRHTMTRHGWRPENDEPCVLTGAQPWTRGWRHMARFLMKHGLGGVRAELARDGCQTWCNPRFDDRVARR